MLKSTR